MESFGGPDAKVARETVIGLLRAFDSGPALLLSGNHLPTGSSTHMAFLGGSRGRLSHGRFTLGRTSHSSRRSTESFDGAAQFVTLGDQKGDDLLCGYHVDSSNFASSAA